MHFCAWGFSSSNNVLRARGREEGSRDMEMKWRKAVVTEKKKTAKKKRGRREQKRRK